MKLSFNNNAVLGLLSVLLAFPAVAKAIKTRITVERGAAREVTSRRLADCTEDDFLVTEFVTIEGGFSTNQTTYEGCYEVAGTVGGEDYYKIDGDLTTAGGAFYASDNNGGNPDTAWYFADVAANTTANNASDSFLCFDLDLNPTADTHPADVTSWGLVLDEDATNVARECNITITCGCTAGADDDDSVTPAPTVVEDDDAVEATEGDAAFAITVGGTRFVLVLSTVALMVANLL